MSAKRTLLLLSGGIVIVAASFAATIFILDWLSKGGGLQPALGKTITLIGDATASTATLKGGTSFEFKGNGLARIEDTSDLQCMTNDCSLSVTVEFEAPNPDKPVETIVCQSVAGERGWDLLWSSGALTLQPERGHPKLTAPFTPKPGDRYAIEVKNGKQGYTLTINGETVGSSDQSPFADIARNVTVGGRDGSSFTYYFTGKVSDLRIYSSPVSSHQ